MAQDPHQITELCKALNNATKGSKGRKGISCKKTTYQIANTKGISVDSWRFSDWDYKRDDLPTYARGLFTTKRSDGTPEIVIRGYDKFFNVDEVPSTQWSNVQNDTKGPYELSVKENGCIIFMSGLEDGTLLVCSKHSTGARQDVETSHASVGEKWVEKHLKSQDKSTRGLALTLRQMNATAVAELCDDAFEEHVLEYPPEMAGLYLHGINLNQPEFATLPGPEVHAFADQWGFKKAQYLIIESLSEVKSFLEECAETGAWDGRDTEGFVVRCKLQGKGGNPGPDWFFKYKFEEPYLMYRQWRECTKAVIAGRDPKYKKHKKITEEYLLFARQQLARDKNLGKAYNLNHGIIKMRDDFLAMKGQKGSDIIRQEQDQEEDSNVQTVNVVLVPIATIGCGKTTIATALVKLFNFGHIQNDNIEGQKGRPQRFANMVTNTMAAFPAVIADRNNHQRREREQIIRDVSSVVPDAKFVALHYVHEPKNLLLDEIRSVTRKRVLDRGDNHQTIRAGSKSNQEIIEIMEGFLTRFQGCNTNIQPDNDFDEVINLDVCASSVENLETVITRLYNAYPQLFPQDMPSQEDMQNAIDFSLNSQVSTKHDLSFGGKQPRQAKNHRETPPPQRQSAPAQVPTPAELVSQLEYFSIPVPVNDIANTLNGLFSNATAEEGRIYHQLKNSRRIQAEFHVTLIHRASSKDNAKLWSLYTGAYMGAVAGADLADRANRTPTLGTARIKLERLVWDDRVMAMVVRIYPSADGNTWETANSVAHITIGTVSSEIKPKESNDLLTKWEAGGQVWEKAITGGKVIDTKVQPVFQHGRG